MDSFSSDDWNISGPVENYVINGNFPNIMELILQHLSFCWFNDTFALCKSAEKNYILMTMISLAQKNFSSDFKSMLSGSHEPRSSVTALVSYKIQRKPWMAALWSSLRDLLTFFFIPLFIVSAGCCVEWLSVAGWPSSSLVTCGRQQWHVCSLSCSSAPICFELSKLTSFELKYLFGNLELSILPHLNAPRDHIKWRNSSTRESENTNVS